MTEKTGTQKLIIKEGMTGSVIPWSGYDVQLIVERIDERAKMPEYADPEDAGLDVFACLFDDEGNPVDEVTVAPGETKLINLGIKVGIPRGWYLELVPRSGISLHTPLRIANTPGTIDTNFKGVLHAVVTNTSESIEEPSIIHCSNKGNLKGIYSIRTGDKIAQIIPTRRYRAQLVQGKATDIGSDRGGGYGHTGV